MDKQREIYIIRHGETEWSKSGQHTGMTDLSLTETGIQEAKHLQRRLKGILFDHVFSSPLKRAYDTCHICGLDGSATITDALLEWNYGDYEGKKSVEIHKKKPGWNIFLHGAPNGESPDDVSKRADQLLLDLKNLSGRTVLFSSGHFSRALSARFLGFPVEMGRHLILSTASLSILSYERQTPALKLWNDICHNP